MDNLAVHLHISHTTTYISPFFARISPNENTWSNYPSQWPNSLPAHYRWAL